MSCPRGPVTAGTFLGWQVLAVECDTRRDHALHEPVPLVDDEVLVRGDMGDDLTAIILVDDACCVTQPHAVSGSKGRTRIEFKGPGHV